MFLKINLTKLSYVINYIHKQFSGFFFCRIALKKGLFKNKRRTISTLRKFNLRAGLKKVTSVEA